MQKLREMDSFAKVFGSAGRHKRLCLQNPNGKKYADALEVTLNDCSIKKNEYSELENAYTMSVDKVHLNTLKLNDCLRKVHGRCLEYDRENPGKKVTGFIFPDGNLSPVMRLSTYKKTDAVADIIRKLVSLGNTNGLFALNTELKTAYDACMEAIAAEETALNMIKDADVVLEKLKIKLMKQYNDNYHSASIDFDKNYAEMLFPNLKAKSKKEVPVAEVKEIEKK